MLVVLAVWGEYIFTTYNSLHRIIADIEVNNIYFDEAHNSVKKNFFPATEYFAENGDRCYFILQLDS